MISTIRELYFTETGKDTAITFVGTFINLLFGALFFILTPRILGPQEYGIFSTVVSTSILLISIANFGIDTGILRFAKLPTDRFEKILSIAFKSYVVFGIVAGIVGYFLSPVLSTLLKVENIVPLLRIAFSGTVLLLLSNYFVAERQARGQFLTASIVSLSGNLARLVLLLMAIWFLKIQLISLTIIFFLAPIASAIFGYFISPVKLKKNSAEEFFNFFKFNIWVALALMISSVPYDNYLLIKLAGPQQTGIYAAPFKILTFSFIFGGNFTRVLASRLTTFDSYAKVLTFSKKALAIPAVISFLIIISIPFASLIINVLFGDAYRNSVGVYQFLSIGFASFFLSTIPSSIIVYYFGKSSISFFITVAKYLLLLLSMLILIPKYQAQGAAISFTIAELVSLLLMTAYAFIMPRR